MQTSSWADTVLSSVAEYESDGWKLVPIRHADKRPPRGYANWQKRNPDEVEWRKLLSNDDIGIAGVVGPISNGTVDVDLDWRSAAQFAKLNLPESGMISGHALKPYSHWFYRPSTPVPGGYQIFVDPIKWKSGSRKNATILELRTAKEETVAMRYTVLPPSVHISGNPYIWYKQNGWTNPEGLKLEIEARRTAAQALLAEYWREGTRHASVMALAGWLLRSRWSLPNVETFILAICEYAGDLQISDHRTTIRDTYAKLKSDQHVTGLPTLRKPEMFGEEIMNAISKWLEPTLISEAIDLGTAQQDTDEWYVEKLIRLYGNTIRYVREWRAWYIFNGKAWEPLPINDQVAEMGKVIIDESNRLTGKAQEEHAKRGLKLLMFKKQIDIIGRAQTARALMIKSEELDNHPELLNLENGTYDFVRGSLVPHSAANFLTRMARVNYDPDAECPYWDQFMLDIMLNDIEMVRFIQRAIGYTLTGYTDERVLLIMHGSGGNGKTIFIETMAMLYDCYAAKAPASMMLSNRQDAHPTDIDSIRGARFVHASETEMDRRLAEAKIKELTGGDKITSRKMYQDFSAWTPEHTIWLATNYRPLIRGVDKGIWDRVKLIPFDARFEGSQRVDKEVLLSRFRSELSGILNWILAGYYEYQETGIRYPDKVLDAVKEYQAEMDVIGQWIEQECDLGPHWKDLASDLYESFRDFCSDNGHQPMSVVTFGKELERRGFDRKREAVGIYRIGIRRR